jgi:hypothetical protein
MTMDWSTAVPWVFSGIGVSVAGLIGKVVYKHFSDARKAKDAKDKAEISAAANNLIAAERIESSVQISESTINGPVAGVLTPSSCTS